MTKVTEKEKRIILEESVHHELKLYTAQNRNRTLSQSVQILLEKSPRDVKDER